MLNQRAGALVNRLLVEADRQRFPLALLNGPATEASRTDWQVRYDRALMEALAEVERSRTRPRGLRRLLQFTVVGLSNVLPELVFVAAFLLILWRFFDPQNVGYKVTAVDLLLPFALTLFVLVFLQLLSAILLPVRWSAVRDEFHRKLVGRLEDELKSVYAGIPAETAEALLKEQARVNELLGELREVRTWLDSKQTAASVAGSVRKLTIRSVAPVAVATLPQAALSCFLHRHLASTQLARAEVPAARRFVRGCARGEADSRRHSLDAAAQSHSACRDHPAKPRRGNRPRARCCTRQSPARIWQNTAAFPVHT